MIHNHQLAHLRAIQGDSGQPSTAVDLFKKKALGPVGSDVSRQSLARTRDGSSAGLVHRRRLSASFLQRGAGAAAQQLCAEAASTASASAAGFSARELADEPEFEPGARAPGSRTSPLIVNRRMGQHTPQRLPLTSDVTTAKWPIAIVCPARRISPPANCGNLTASGFAVL